MSVICFGGFCIPLNVFWPVILLMLKPLWDYLGPLLGFKAVEKKVRGLPGCLLGKM
jgi:hypothetical protein